MKKSRYLAIIIAVLLVGVLLYARRPRTWSPMQEKDQNLEGYFLSLVGGDAS